MLNLTSLSVSQRINQSICVKVNQLNETNNVTKVCIYKNKLGFWRNDLCDINATQSQISNNYLLVHCSCFTNDPLTVVYDYKEIYYQKTTQPVEMSIVIYEWLILYIFLFASTIYVILVVRQFLEVIRKGRVFPFGEE